MPGKGVTSVDTQPLHAEPEEPADRRTAPRLEIGLPVELDCGKGWTCDVSASGVFFETKEPMSPGAPIRFSLLLEQSASGPLRLECEGRVVRVEQRDGEIGVAATFAVSRLVPIYGDAGPLNGRRLRSRADRLNARLAL